MYQYGTCPRAISPAAVLANTARATKRVRPTNLVRCMMSEARIIVLGISLMDMRYACRACAAGWLDPLWHDGTVGCCAAAYDGENAAYHVSSQKLQIFLIREEDDTVHCTLIFCGIKDELGVVRSLLWGVHTAKHALHSINLTHAFIQC